MTTLPETAPAVRWIVRTLEDAGHETWTVGGAVRDLLLGVPSVDWDLATRARPGQVRKLFPRTVPIGIEHGTVGVLARDGTLYEVTTFRKDVETFGRHAVVEFADRIEDDLARRDFTINAVAWHPVRDELRDPFGGRDDMKRGVLRTVGTPADRFAEDYLRVLRALRFAGRFGLDIDPSTWEALCDAVEHLPGLSAERIREELLKIMEKDRRPSGALSLYAASGALLRVAPEIAALVGSTRVDAPEGLDRWSTACLAADALARSRPFLRIASLLLEVGVPVRVPGQGSGGGQGPQPGSDRSSTGEEGVPALEGGPAPGADEDPAPMTGDEPESIAERGGHRSAALLTRLRFSNAQTDRLVGLVRGGAHPPAGTGDEATARRWLSRTGPERLPDLVRLWGARARVEAAVRGSEEPVERTVDVARRLRGVLAEQPPLAVGDLELDGGDLIRMGMKPGPHFGRILDDLLEAVLEDPDLNDRSSLEERVRSRWSEFLDGETDG